MEPLPSSLAHALLQRFAPILRFTSGERFFPMAVDPYVGACSLWLQPAKGDAIQLAQEGKLTLAQLGRPWPGGEGSLHYLKFIEPLDLGAMAAQALSGAGPPGRGGEFVPDRARLARVGYLSRFADAAYSLALLARGRVRGDTAAAAALSYTAILQQDPRFCYYGRAVRQGDWTVLQYWYFYAFNNWRSGFSGANDHESDWEMAAIFLAESAAPAADGDAAAARFTPEWIAYAAHDYFGDDLRRHWSDPEVGKEGEHPIVYVGAGSHASYFAPGEYLTELALPYVSPLVRSLDNARHFLGDEVGLYVGEHDHDDAGNPSSFLRIPFVDYARGDGLSIGHGQPETWAPPRLISPAPRWVNDYRGLWGLYTKDRFNGENAPSGPKYNRDGSVRRAWYDPLGWAGLDKVLPAPSALRTVESQIVELRRRQQDLSGQVVALRRELTGLGTRVDAMRGLPHLDKVRKLQEADIVDVAAQLDGVQSEMAVNESLLEALRAHEVRLRAGDIGPVRDHIQRAHKPASDDKARIGRITEIWAALSVTVLLFLIVVAIVVASDYLFEALFALLTLIIVLEAAFRRRLPRLITGSAILLAIIASGVLLFELFPYFLVLAIFLIGSYLLFENVRELTR